MSSPMYSPTGTQVEYLVLNASELAPSPTGVSFAAASTIPANGLTALQALDVLGLVIRLHACDHGRCWGGRRLRGGVGAPTRYPRSWRREVPLTILHQRSGSRIRASTGRRCRGHPSSVPEGVDGLLDAAGSAPQPWVLCVTEECLPRCCHRRRQSRSATSGWCG